MSVARPLLALALMLAAPLAGCGDDGGPAVGCPRGDVPEVCPTPAPSFAGEIDGIIQTRCSSCHAPGGLEPSRPYQTYEQITMSTPTTAPSRAALRDMLLQVSQCRMPRAPAPPLLEDERRALLAWLVCGMPNN